MNETLLEYNRKRELLGAGFSRQYRSHRHATGNIIERLGLETELQGHSGCVNCLEWSKEGNLLASGSDDCNVILWSPMSHRKLTTYRTQHNGNIFSVKFMPRSLNRVLATGAADTKITVLDIESTNTLHVFTNHKGRVKRLAVAEDEPHLLFSAGEDGTVMQFDLRCPEEYSKESPRSVIVNLNHYVGISAEAKCLSICPTKTELLAVGSGDPYVRLYDRRMIRCSHVPNHSADTCDEQYNLPANCVNYFVPGHVPSKVEDYSRRYRMLAATYLTFSPDGRDLLVNLGGEQIYLYNIYEKTRSYRLERAHRNGCHTSSCAGDTSSSQPNGYHSKNYTSFVLSEECSSQREEKSTPLPPNIEFLKQQANHNYEGQRYAESVSLYNKAIFLHPAAAVLYSNRAAALLKRSWNGDDYAALADCFTTIGLDSQQYKAFYRLCRCLLQLGRLEEAMICFEHFERVFPERASGHSFEKLKEELQDNIASKNNSPSGKSKRANSENDGVKIESRQQEMEWKHLSYDYSQRFCGHCNTTTDIKEANFIGDNGQYICAGSDDGSFFIWDRLTSNIVRTLRGDECIVNCVQPHPEICLLATSGIDPVVRLWSPLQEGVKNERHIDNTHAAAGLNQRRMNADPLEVMLMNMGHTLHSFSSSDSDNENGGGRDMQCRPF